jgi:hypothetical protein
MKLTARLALPLAVFLPAALPIACSGESTNSTSDPATAGVVEPGPVVPDMTPGVDPQPAAPGPVTPSPDAIPSATPPNPAVTPDPAAPTPDPAAPAPDPAAPTPTPDPATPAPDPDPATPTPDPAVDPAVPLDPTPDPIEPEPDPADPVDEPEPEPASEIECASPEEETFSFFLISYEAMQRESGSPDGFGGDFGGITGADALCQRVAEFSSPCASNQTWRAFLSTTTEDAIDRIGTGPWLDRVGRLWANNIDELLNDRPPNADPEIINDIPNEYGVPNEDPDLTGPVDNHQTLTGSGPDGRIWTQDAEAGGGGGGFGGGGGSESCTDGWTPEKATCWDWTSKEPEGCPRVGHSWPSELSGVNWISVWNEGGCAPGINLVQTGGLNGDPTVGSAGGYGGYYCFAMTGE